MLFVSTIFCLIAGSLAQVSLTPGPCPTNVTLVDLSLVRLSGKWYKYASTENEYDDSQSCIEDFWYPPENGVTTMDSKRFSKETGNPVRIERKITKKEDLSLAEFDIAPVNGKLVSRYWNIKTIYDSYAVSWVCDNYGPNHAESIAIFTRDRNPKIDVMEKAREVAARNGLSAAGLKKFDQENCD